MRIILYFIFIYQYEVKLFAYIEKLKPENISILPSVNNSWD